MSDLEEKLERLRRLKEARDTSGQEYEHLRDEIAAELEGQRYFIGADGRKYRGYPRTDEMAVYDLTLLEDELPDEVFDQITYTKVDSEAFEQAHRAGRISDDLLVRAVRYKPKKTSIRVEPIDG